MSTRATDRMLSSLAGLCVGDAFGERFFVSPDVVDSLIEQRATPQPPWPYTDDTAMAMSLAETLLVHGEVDVEDLGRRFAARYAEEPGRGYGPSMHDQMRRLIDGESPYVVAPSMFGGSGSYGNGSAMRVAPLGAFFVNEPQRLTQQAVLSSTVTHTHPEAQAGAIAVAVATALLCREEDLPFDDFISCLIDAVPSSEVRRGLRKALVIGAQGKVAHAAQSLGSGNRISAQDTVPFCVWIVAGERDDFERALWKTVSGLGDRDTTCAIVGGMLGARLGREGIPAAWCEAAEQPDLRCDPPDVRGR